MNQPTMVKSTVWGTNLPTRARNMLLPEVLSHWRLSPDFNSMPSANAVWGAVLRQHGFYRDSLPHVCPDCYTVAEFCADHPRGIYVLGTDGHVVTAIDGDWYDVWDSGDEIVTYYWYRKEK